MTRDELKGWGKNDLIREVQRLRGLLEQQLNAAPGIGDEVTVEGIVSFTTEEPQVTMRAGEAAWQFTPAAARQHALIVLDAAVEAERDAATVSLLKQMALDGGADDEAALEQAAGFLVVMRDHRSDWLESMRSAA